MSEKNQTFSLWCNNKKFELIASIFAQLSKQAALLMEAGIYEGDIIPRVRPESFTTFVAVCQLQPFKISSSCVFELEMLANDWEVPSLLKYCDDYIKSRNLERPPDEDYLGQLLDHLSKGIQDPNDVPAVANMVNLALQDDRFMKVPPETIFQILLTAESRGVDEQLLINFVMRTFEIEPTTAVPLVLLCNFDLFTPEQRDKLFQSREMHEQSLGFFIAESISATTNRIAKQLSLTERIQQASIADLKAKLQTTQKTPSNNIHEEGRTDVLELKKHLAKQQNIIDGLIKDTEDVDLEIKMNTEDQKEDLNKVRQELAELDETMENSGTKIATLTDEALQNTKQEIENIRKDIEQRLNNLEKQNTLTTEKMRNDLIQPMKSYKTRLAASKSDATTLEELLKTTINEVADLQAVTAAKIVRDRLKHDEVVRKIEERFSIFENEDSLWGLTPQQVQEAEEFINMIEKRVEQSCPIRKDME